MTRFDHGASDVNGATGTAPDTGRTPNGRIVGYGMGSGVAHSEGGAQYPQSQDMGAGAGAGVGAGAPYAWAQQTEPQVQYAQGQMQGQGQPQVQGQPELQPQYYAQPQYAQAQVQAQVAQQPQAVVQPQPQQPTATQSHQPQADEPKKKRKVGFWIALIVVILCVILACLLLLTMCDGKSKREGSLGQLEGKTDAEIQAELDRVVDEGMFNISIASSVLFDNGNAAGELRIENVPGNHYLMKVDIVRDDTGEKIYETDLIEPNHHIQSDTLDVSLPAGYYDCTAIFQAFDMETEEQVGQAAAKIVIQVVN